MITISAEAENALKKILDERGGEDCLGLRLEVTGGVPGAYQSGFRLVKAGEVNEDDIILDQGSFKVFIDPESAPKLAGVRIDLVPTFRGPSFRITYPIPEWEDPLAARVQKLISERINPGVASHGGFVTLLGVEDGVVYLSMGGGCQGCGLASATLRQGIEVMIREHIPEVRAVVDRTDHAQGVNPFYKPVPGKETLGKSPLVK